MNAKPACQMSLMADIPACIACEAGNLLLPPRALQHGAVHGSGRGNCPISCKRLQLHGHFFGGLLSSDLAMHLQGYATTSLLQGYATTSLLSGT